MSINSKLNKLIEVLQEGPVLPGGIRESFGTCGKPNCKCNSVDDPKLHGPYNILSFSLKEASSTMSLSEKEALLASKMVKRFQEAKSLLNELGIAYVSKGRGNNISNLEAPELGQRKRRGKSIAEKNKSKEQSKKNEENRMKIKNLTRDLENAKKKCNKLKDEKETLRREISLLKSTVSEQEKKTQLDVSKKKVLTKN